MAIVARFPDPLGRRLDVLRRRFDPEADRAMAAHIPLTALFQSEPSLLPLERHCWRVCHETPQFRVELGRIVEHEGGLQAEVTAGRDELAALREALLAGQHAPPTGDAPFESRAVVGWRPLRDALVVADIEEAIAKSNRSFYVERIELMAQYPDGTWYERDFYTLDRAVVRA